MLNVIRDDVVVLSLDHEHFEVRSHHPINVKHPRYSVELFQIETAASSRLDERFQDDVHSYLVPESKAVGHSADHIRHLDSLALDSMLFDSKIEQRR